MRQNFTNLVDIHHCGKCSISCNKNETNPIKSKRMRKKEVFEAKYILNSIGVSCLVSFAASREERVVKRVGYDLKVVLRRLTCDRDGDQAKVGLWGGGGGGDERSELERAEAAIAIGFVEKMAASVCVRMCYCLLFVIICIPVLIYYKLRKRLDTARVTR